MQVLSELFEAGRRAPLLWVWLPPAGATAEEMQTRGFAAVLRESGQTADILFVGLPERKTLDGSAVMVLREQVIGPARAAGYSRIWLAGISLGGFNALHYAARHAQDLAGLALFAPYPGTRDVLAEIAAASPAAYVNPPGVEDERLWWGWLAGGMRAGGRSLPVWCGCSDQDRFAAGQRMLTGLLPTRRVRWIEGAHDWPVWLRLWREFLTDFPSVAASERA